MDGERPAADLPKDAAAMLEGALARLGADEGTWELWLRADDLRIRKYRLTSEGGRDHLQTVNPEGEER